MVPKSAAAESVNTEVEIGAQSICCDDDSEANERKVISTPPVESEGPPQSATIEEEIDC